jgi:hypothetical protein
MGHDPGGFQLRWRQLTGSDATLDNAHVAEDYLARTTTLYRTERVNDFETAQCRI